MAPYVPNLHGNATLLRTSDHDFSWVNDIASEGKTTLPLGFNSDGTSNGLAWDVALLQGHGLTIGTNRSGKGVSAIIPALLTYKGSMIVVDPKGENSWLTAPRRRMLGNLTAVLDPWNIVNQIYKTENVDPEPVASYNPLSSLNIDDPDFADDCVALADALIIPATKDNAHWTDAARDMLAGLIAWVVEEEEGNATLQTVRKLLTMPLPALKDAIGDYCAESPNSVGGLKLASFSGGSTGRENENEQASIRSTAKTQTTFLDSAAILKTLRGDAKDPDTETVLPESPDERFEKTMKHIEESALPSDPVFADSESSSTVDLRDLLSKNGMTIYLVLPPGKLQTHARWLRLMLTMIIREVVRSGDADPLLPVLMMLDEFGTIGKLGIVETAFGLMSGLGLRIWAFIQDLNQLKRDYPESWETFVSNASVLQILNVRDITTSQYISELLGTSTIDYFEGEQTVERMHYLTPEEIARVHRETNPSNPAYIGWLNPDTKNTHIGGKPRDAEYIQDLGKGPFVKRRYLDPIVHQIPRALILPQDIRKIPKHESLFIVEGENYQLFRFYYYVQFAHWVRRIPWFEDTGQSIENTLRQLHQSPAPVPVAENDNHNPPPARPVSGTPLGSITMEEAARRRLGGLR